jgi:hypothetical protein
MADLTLTLADFDTGQFTRPQAAAITGLTDGQLKGILDRKLVKLASHNPGSGHSRLFSISDLIKIAVANAMARIGVPMRTLANCAESVDDEARLLFRRGPVTSYATRDHWKEDLPTGGSHLMLYPAKGRDGPWTVDSRFLDSEDDPLGWERPTCYVLLNTDEVILQTLARIASYVTARQPAKEHPSEAL